RSSPTMPATGPARRARDPPNSRCRRLLDCAQPYEPMSVHLRVNPITCEAHGLCAELLPEMITLDDWGYPLIDGSTVAPELRQHAERAAATCPTFALLLERRQRQH
ncbi:MAG: ferredoxin, partial [Solirubrobacteraceae bacterium]